MTADAAARSVRPGEARDGCAHARAATPTRSPRTIPIRSCGCSTAHSRGCGTAYTKASTCDTWSGLSEIAAGQRARVCAVPSQPHRLHAARIRDLSQRLAPPHIAAGVNLNLPIVGSILRRGGAFFIRRSFRGQCALHGRVPQLLPRRFSREDFRSSISSRERAAAQAACCRRSSGLLHDDGAKLRADRNRPFVFVPVYLGYEKVVEGATFVERAHRR